MDISKYQQEAHRLDSNRRLAVSVLGLVGEAGGVQTALKKRLITRRPSNLPPDDFAEELGDYLWYLSSICSLNGVSLQQLAIEAGNYETEVPETRAFNTLQKALSKRAGADSRARAVQALARIAVDIQQLTSIETFARMRRPGAPFSPPAQLSELAGEALIAIVDVANGFELKLSDVATKNLEKVRSLYELGPVRNFDGGYPPDERIPRAFSVSFSEERARGGKRRVRLKINDVIVGNTLTDNVDGDDGYRFHDVFHLAFLALLGWSPVIRSLLRRKRKSDASVDENEDGARAAIIEEAISLYVFQNREKFGGYEELTEISHGLLGTIRALAKDLEVSECTSKEWQLAIRQGYEVFRSSFASKGASSRLT